MHPRPSMILCVGAGLGLALLGGCADPLALLPMPLWEAPFVDAVAVDVDPAPDRVDVELEAREAEVEIAEGRTVRLWTYDGKLPGPRLEARVGDRVRVRFRNRLPEATTIHWHGLRLENAMDGAAMVQAPVQPGGEFVYDFTVRDVGTFWFHPHVRSDEQVERGLYGAIVVRGPNEPEVASDQVVVLDDLLVDPGTFQLQPFGGSREAMLGRQGNVLLANGRAQPVVELRAGGLHRFRFVNAANARYFRLALEGRRRFWLLGVDGGPLEAPREVDELLVVPGARFDVVVRVDDEEGATLDWQALPYERGHGTGGRPVARVMRLRAVGSSLGAPAAPNVAASDVPVLPASTVQRELRFQEGMMAGASHGGHDMHGSGGSMMGPRFSINGASFPEGAPLRATLGDVEAWTLVNETEMDHPFHLHGFRFQVLDVDGVGPDFRAWHDTVNLPARKTVRIAVPLEEFPGRWMFHCHLLEHAERGMAGELEVRAP